MMKDKDICDKNLTSKGKKRKMEKPDKTDVPSPTEVDTNEYSLRVSFSKHILNKKTLNTKSDNYC